MSSAIVTRRLKKWFGDVRAVDGVDLTVNRGEMLGIVGPDGAGKTTTIRMLAGVLMPDAGDATLLGYDLWTDMDEIKRHIGYLSQQFSLYTDLSIDENIEFAAQIHDVTDFADRREELLEFTRLTPFRKRFAGRLSGGMKQKLALACTLIHEPDIILLDEPTTGVDPVSRRDFWLILADLLRRDIAIVMTTPYLDEAERCHRVALMYEGRVIRNDTPEAIIDAVRGDVMEIRADRPHEAYIVLREQLSETTVQLFGERIHVLVENSGADESAKHFRTLLEAANISVADIRRITPSLEDAFIELVSAQRADDRPVNVNEG